GGTGVARQHRLGQDRGWHNPSLCPRIAVSVLCPVCWHYDPPSSLALPGSDLVVDLLRPDRPWLFDRLAAGFYPGIPLHYEPSPDPDVAALRGALPHLRGPALAAGGDEDQSPLLWGGRLIE